MQEKNNSIEQYVKFQKDIDLKDFYQSLQQLLYSDQKDNINLAVKFLENSNNLHKGLYYQSVKNEIFYMDKFINKQIKYQRVSQLINILIESQKVDPKFINIVIKIMKDICNNQDQQNFIAFLQKIKGKNMKQFLIKLQDQKKYDDLIELLLIFQEKQYQDIIDIELLIKHLFQKQKKPKQLIQLLKIYNTNIQSTIKQFNNNQSCNIIADIIKHFNYDIKDYPKVMERLQKKFIRYYINHYNWMRIELALFQQPQMLAFALEDMFYKKQYNEVYSINKRYDLLQKGYIRKIELKQFLSTFNEKNQYLENLLCQMDRFINTERIINENEINKKMKIKGKQQIADAQNYLCLQDQGILDENFYYIDNIQNENFKYSVDQLLKSQIIGLDTEFTNNFTKFDLQEIATMQLSNESDVFIFDVIKLKKEKQFRNFVKTFMESDKILKLGHSLSCDLQQINNTFKSYEQLNFLNYIDIAKVYRHLFPTDNKYALSHIVKQILNKEFSKLEQCSNWEQRPLRKAQLHYAALDAYVCIVLYQHLKKINQDNEEMDNLEFFVENSYCDQEFSSQNQDKQKYQQQNQQDKQEKFVTIKYGNEEKLQNLNYENEEKQQYLNYGDKEKQQNQKQYSKIFNQQQLSQYVNNNQVQILFDDPKYFFRLNYYLNNMKFEFIKEQKFYEEQETIVQYGQQNKYIIITKNANKYEEVVEVPILKLNKNDLQRQLKEIKNLQQMITKIDKE